MALYLQKASFCSKLVWPQPLHLIWLSICASYTWILVLVLLQPSGKDHTEADLDDRWHVSDETHRVASNVGAAACGAFFLVFAFASGYSRGVKWSPVFATCLYCGCAHLTFLLDGMELQYHPYELELHFVGLHSSSAVHVYFLIGSLISMLHGAEKANAVLRKPALVFMVLWSLLWPGPRFVTKLWPEPPSVVLAIILDGFYLSVSLFGGLIAVKSVRGLLKLHWTVQAAAGISWIAQVVAEVINLMIAAGGTGMQAADGFIALQGFILSEVLCIGVFVLSAIMSYEESWRFEAERDAAQAELKMRIQQQVQAQQAEQARQKFLRYIFHEIRGPFNSLDMGLGLIMDDISAADAEEQAALIDAIEPAPEPDRLILPGDARVTLDIMAKAAASMKVIINDTLDWTKLQSGAFQISLGATRLTDLVSGTVVGLSTFAMHPDNRVKLVQEIDPRLPSWLLGDKVRLQQVVANFLSNAIKFAPHDGTGVVTVRIQVIDGGNAWQTRMQGMGDDPRAFEGTGIWWKDASDSVEAVVPHTPMHKGQTQAPQDAQQKRMSQSGFSSPSHTSAHTAASVATPVGNIGASPVEPTSAGTTASAAPPARPTQARAVVQVRRAPSFQETLHVNMAAATAPAPARTSVSTIGDISRPTATHASKADAAPLLRISPPPLQMATERTGQKRAWLPRMFSGAARSSHAYSGGVPTSAVPEPASEPLSGSSTSEVGKSQSVSPAYPRMISKQESSHRITQALIPADLRPPVITSELRDRIVSEGFRFLRPGEAGGAEGSAIFSGSGSAASYADVDQDNGGESSASAEHYCTLVIGVTDNGDGVAPADIPTLFRAFKQLDAGMQYKGKGTGLGLAICHEIVSQHGGRVGVRSSGVRGQGAEFMVALRLPVLQRAAPMVTNRSLPPIRDYSVHRSDTISSDVGDLVHPRTAITSSTDAGAAAAVAVHSGRSSPSLDHGMGSRSGSARSERAGRPTSGAAASRAYELQPSLSSPPDRPMLVGALSAGRAYDTSLPAASSPPLMYLDSPQDPLQQLLLQTVVSEHRTRGVHEQMLRRAAAAAAITADALTDPHSDVLPVTHGLHGVLQVGIRLSAPNSPNLSAGGLPGQVFIPLCACGEPLTGAGVCPRCAQPGGLVSTSPQPARTHMRSLKITQGDGDRMLLSQESGPLMIKRPSNLHQARGGGSVNSNGSTASAGPGLSLLSKPPLLGPGLQQRHGGSAGDGRPYIPPLPIARPTASADPTAASSSAASAVSASDIVHVPSPPADSVRGLHPAATGADIVSIPVMPPMGDHPRDPSGWSAASGRSSEDGASSARSYPPSVHQLGSHNGVLPAIAEAQAAVPTEPASNRTDQLTSTAAASTTAIVIPATLPTITTFQPEPLTRTQGVVRILVVDDVADSRKLLSKALRRRIEQILAKEAPNAGRSVLNIEIDQAEDGHIAVQMVTGRPVENLSSQECPACSLGNAPEAQPVKYDVITMDAEMPVLSGFRATELLRSAGYAGLLYGCTGNSLEEDQQLFIACGANGVFIKPLDIQGLAYAVIRGLGLATLDSPVPVLGL